MLAVLDAEHVECALAWGFSLGAKDAASLAVRAPERVSAFVYGSGQALTRPDHNRAQWTPFAAQLTTTDDLIELWASFGFTDPAAVADALGRNDVAALAATVEGTAAWWPQPEDIAVPGLWYVGEAEGGFDEDETAFAADHDVEIHVVAGADHFGAFARSADVLSFVQPFLARHREPT